MTMIPMKKKKKTLSVRPFFFTFPYAHYKTNIIIVTNSRITAINKQTHIKVTV